MKADPCTFEAENECIGINYGLAYSMHASAHLCSMHASSLQGLWQTALVVGAVPIQPRMVGTYQISDKLSFSL